MAEWYQTQLNIADREAARIKRAFLNRISRTRDRTNWTLVESMIPNGPQAVYNAVQWEKWIAGEQVAPAYNKMYDRSQIYLQKYAIKKAGVALEISEQSFRMPNPEAERWLQFYSATEVKNITESEFKMVRDVVTTGQKELRTNRETAKILQNTVGLTDGQFTAYNNYRNNLLKGGMKTAQVEKLSDRYYNKLLKYRSETIALTESHTATNRAWQDSIRNDVREGVFNDKEYEMYWIVTPDDRMCFQCSSQIGKTASVSEQNFSPSNPPLHPRCRCTTGVRQKKSVTRRELKPEVSRVQETLAIQDYSREGYRDMNAGLRAAGTVTNDVVAIDSLMNRSTLKGDEVLFRGLTSQPLLDSLDTLQGTIIKDPAFMSTTLDRNVATRFLDLAAAEQKTKGILMEIRMPKGAHGIYMTDYLHTDNAKAEREVLLPRGSEFEVKRVQKLLVAGVSHIKLTLAPVLQKGIRMINEEDVLRKGKVNYDKFVDDGIGLIILREAKENDS